MKRAHQIVGLATLAVFLGTGVYMRTHFPGIYRSDAGIRMMFRANHVYILLTALLNLGLGSYVVLYAQRWRRALQWAGSGLVLIATPVLIAAFFYEPVRGSWQRPMTLHSVVLLLVGTLLHLISGIGEEK